MAGGAPLWAICYPLDAHLWERIFRCLIKQGSLRQVITLSAHLPSGPSGPGWEQTVPLKSTHFISGNQPRRQCDFSVLLVRVNTASQRLVQGSLLLKIKALEHCSFICAFPPCITWQGIVCSQRERDFEYSDRQEVTQEDSVIWFCRQVLWAQEDCFQVFIHSLIHSSNNS